MSVASTIAGRPFELTVADVQQAVAGVLPEPVRDHFVVVDGRRYPPKQVIALVTGLDRADFTTHQARRTLRRLGLVVGRAGQPDTIPAPPSGREHWPYQGRQAAALEPYIGKWVVFRGTEVLVATDDREDALAWAVEHDIDDAGLVFLSGDERRMSGGTSWSFEL